ncbi:MAG: hypothetical protein JSV62_07940 [Promethearchaeota archaeon]|nr:MAG: hypothetical protein JSV62_07940 [Candidatus Lokiarchaeota archaeon]
MERRNKEKVLEMIKDIERKKSEMEEYITNLSIPSRNDMLKKISHNIINNNSLLQELIGSEKKIISSRELEKSSSDSIIEGYINKIKKDPYKKIIFLKEFLNLFEERIAEKDKEVILKSLKDEKNIEKLKERMLSLAEIFELNL